ncbi:MAG: mercury methylation corrinoid protein HgcA, partial [Kiritimatiellia bacterium]
VIYGPVYAADIPAFLQDGLQATPAMRRVRFTLRERLAVVPLELVQRFTPALCIMLAFFLASGITRSGYHWTTAHWPRIALAVWMNFLAGIFLTPVLLFRLPGRAFAIKGAITGLATGAALWLFGRYGLTGGVAVMLLSTAAGSYLGLMFTGSTPYTSASGVRMEVRRALPLQIAATGLGITLWCSALWRGWL